MRNVNNSVDTVNAAASAIVSAESRVQPSQVQKKRWRSFWTSYWCFGSQKNKKRIGHAVLVPEQVATGAPMAPLQNSSTNSTSIFLPFIAPPSSPSSFLQSDPSSVSHTPHGLLSLTVNTYSQNEPSSVFAIGPYANETQPVTPPVFSAYITEPSTAPFTPPPESAHMTSPSSPEVPFAQLLSSSLELARRNSGGMNQKFSAAHYEFQSHQVYPGSPGGGNLISPGSVISNSGTSSPYPGKCSIVEFRIGEPPKFLGFEHFTARKWGSRFGSGSITPVGQGSRLGSGALTPDGGGGLGSKLASGDVTPNGAEAVSRMDSVSDSQISVVASLANSDDGSSRHDEAVEHRVSFELTGEDIARCLASKLSRADLGDGLHDKESGEQTDTPINRPNEEVSGSEQSRKLRSCSLGWSKEFNFDNTNEETAEKTAVRSEWWANEKVTGKGDNSPENSWTFFPVSQSGFS